eukprot:9033074-Pyramimonas_sp.AAC.1
MERQAPSASGLLEAPACALTERLPSPPGRWASWTSSTAARRPATCPSCSTTNQQADAESDTESAPPGTVGRGPGPWQRHCKCMPLGLSWCPSAFLGPSRG